MKINNYYQKMCEIYNRLQDEESQSLFEARISYLIDRDEEEYMNKINRLYHDWRSPELEEKIAEIHPKGIILFVCGHDGMLTYRMMCFWGYDVSCFGDNYMAGKIIEGKRVVSVDEIVQKYADYLIVVTSSGYGKEIYTDLLQKGIPYANILWPKYKCLYAVRGKQYFDLFEAQSDEVFVDAGAFDGKNLFDFHEWTGGKYKGIYAFEPLEHMYNEIDRKIEKNNVSRAKIFHNAAWNKREKLFFSISGPGSHINDNGNVVVDGVDIDSVVKDEKVTFIKMDIEGSELAALEGARNTIVNNCPRMAICIYHRPMDVLEIASYILELVPEYKFYIRNYASNMWETVLCAVL